MASSTNNLIKVKDTTKVRLDLFKSNKTYDTVISEMLLYFETTGITPQSNVMPPNIAAKEQANRVIEVVRGIEKSTNVRLKNIEQLLLSLAGEVKTPGDNIRTNICTSHRYRNFWSVPSNWNRKPGKTGRRPGNCKRISK